MDPDPKATLERQTREAKVIAQVRKWLPELADLDAEIRIVPIDPDDNDGAIFTVEKIRRTFACRRGPTP
jgi:hypothetical protein